MVLVELFASELTERAALKMVSSFQSLCLLPSYLTPSEASMVPPMVLVAKRTFASTTSSAKADDIIGGKFGSLEKTTVGVSVSPSS